MLQTPLLDQNGPLEAVHHSILDIMSTTDIAQQLTLFHTQLFEATDEIELVFQVSLNDASALCTMPPYAGYRS